MLSETSSESFEDNFLNSPREEMRQVLKQKAHDLFLLCDRENKGFASKRDMYRLKNQLPLTPEQLDEVFDVLDKDKNGCLTLQEFTEGLGMFLGIDSHVVLQERNEDEILIRVSEVENDEKFDDFLDQLGAHNVFKDEDYVRVMWDNVQKDDPTMLRNFEDFLGKITQELKSTKHEYSSLETNLKNRSNFHDEQVKVLYTEMEEQLKAEKESLLATERLKEQKVRDELETELTLKDQQLQDFILKHMELEKQLQELNAEDSEKKHENVKLQKERDVLENRLSASEKTLKNMQAHLELLRKKSLEERRTRAKAALRVSEGIALERENLVKELQELKKVNKQLLDEKDELVNSAISTPTAGSDAESSGSSNHEKDVLLPRKKKIIRTPKKSPKTQKRLVHTKTDSIEDVEQRPKRQAEASSSELNKSSVSYHPLSYSDVFTEESTPLEGGGFFQASSPLPNTRFSKSEDDCEVDDNFFKNCPQSRLSSGGCLSPQNNLNLIPDKNKMGHNAAHQNNLLVEVDGTSVKQTHGRVADNNANKKIKSSATSESSKTKHIPVNPKTTSKSKVICQNEISNTQSPERVYKIVFIGDSGVGKSSFIHRFCHNTFKKTFSATIGVDFQVKTLTVDGKLIALQLWDTAGQERFRSLTLQYFRKADGIVIVYDVTSETSFKNVRNWMNQVKEGADERVVIMLIGNKIDLCESDDDRVVKTKHGNRLADEYGTIFYETSAKSGNSIEESIYALSSLLTVKEDEAMEEALKLSEDIKNKTKKCC